MKLLSILLLFITISANSQTKLLDEVYGKFDTTSYKITEVDNASTTIEFTANQPFFLKYRHSRDASKIEQINYALRGMEQTKRNDTTFVQILTLPRNTVILQMILFEESNPNREVVLKNFNVKKESLKYLKALKNEK